MRGRKGGGRRSLSGRKLAGADGGGGADGKKGKRRKIRRYKRAGGRGFGLAAAAAAFPQWKVKLLVDAEIKRRKKSENLRLRFERDFAMEELARARSSVRRMKARLSEAAKAAELSAKRWDDDDGANSVDEAPARANDTEKSELSLEDVFRHASSAAAAKQFVSSTLTTLFNPISTKKQSEGDGPEIRGEQDGETDGGGTGGGTPRNSRRNRRKRRRRRQNKRGHNLVSCADFVAVLGAAKESGAILPERDELQLISARLGLKAGRDAGSAANKGGESYLDLEQWALCYPGDASEVLRWSCALAGMHTHVF